MTSTAALVMLAGGAVGIILANVLLLFVDPLDVPDLIRAGAHRARGAIAVTVVALLVLAALFVGR